MAWGLVAAVAALGACASSESGAEAVADSSQALGSELPNGADTADSAGGADAADGTGWIDTVDAADGAGLELSAEGCPAQIPWVRNEAPIACDTAVSATDCAYPAPGCAAGERPDNACRCVPDLVGTKATWRCDSPFHTCLPLPGDAAPGEPTRAVPTERVPAACADPAARPAAPACVPSRNPGNSPGFCETAADCGAGEVCLDTYGIAPTSFGETLCGCHPVSCLDDSGCDADEACACGKVGGTGPCGGFFPAQCSHKCLPAECRSSADCDPGGICSPSKDQCDRGVERYACHYPDRDECLSDAECFGSSGACRYDATSASWACHTPLICD
ncbi:MAG: hypothetical protein R3F39_10875 [Myxococcota bacterium]